MADENNPNGGNGKNGKVGLLEEGATGAKDRHSNEGKRTDRGSERSDEDAGLHVDLPAQTRRHATEPGAGRAFQRLFAPSSGEDQSGCRSLQLHVGYGRDHVLSFHHPDLYRRPADVLLPSDEGAGVSRCALPRARCAFRENLTEHASMGRSPDGDWRVAAYVPRVSDGVV